MDGSFSSEIDRRMLHARCNRRGDSSLSGSAEENHIGLGLRLETTRECGKAIRGPAFRRAIGCAGADGNSKAIGSHASGKKKLPSALAVLLGNVELDERFFRQGIQPASSPKQFEIIILLVNWNFSRLRNRHCFCEKKAATIPGIADAFWNSRAPGNPSRLKSILKQQSHVEFLRAEFAHDVAFVFHKHRVVANPLIPVDGCHIRARKYRYLSFRETRAHSTQSRQRHDGVANPVRGAN